jgi:hypothetical protein
MLMLHAYTEWVEPLNQRLTNTLNKVFKSLKNLKTKIKDYEKPII